MVVTGRGRSGHPHFGCPQNFYRGACPNRVTERQDRLEDKLLAGLQEQVLQPEVVEYAVLAFGKQLEAALADEMWGSRLSTLRARIGNLSDPEGLTIMSDVRRDEARHYNKY